MEASRGHHVPQNSGSLLEDGLQYIFWSHRRRHISGASQVNKIPLVFQGKEGRGNNYTHCHLQFVTAVMGGIPSYGKNTISGWKKLECLHSNMLVLMMMNCCSPHLLQHVVVVVYALKGLECWHPNVMIVVANIPNGRLVYLDVK